MKYDSTDTLIMILDILSPSINLRHYYGTWTCCKFWPVITSSENYQSIRVWLWIVYKITENNCHWKSFTNFNFQVPISFKFKKAVLEFYVLWSQNFSCELNSSRTYSCEISHICRCGFNPKHRVCLCWVDSVDY